MSSFIELGVPARLSAVLAEAGITVPTPIQHATLPDALAGRDVLGRGRTGSGKTIAFLLPLVARLADGRRAQPKRPRALVLAPTRELAGQIEAVLAPLAAAAGLSSCTVYGGVSQNPQVSALRRGVDIVIACPGRLEDLMSQGHCSLAAVEITVLDEADHMADLGFLPGVRRLLKATPRGGQRMLFSATLDKAVDSLVREFLDDPAVHQADSPQSPVGTMTHYVLEVERAQRLPVLVDLTSAPGSTIVFTRTKHGARALTRQLNRSGVPAVELHGNLSQNARSRNLDDFHTGRASALVATDIAARGIHVDDVSLVIHADPPADSKAYLHRSGRTARAGNTGTVVTMSTREQAREVSRLTRAAGIKATTTRVPSTDHPVLTQLAPGARVLGAPIPDPAPTDDAPARSGGGRRRSSGPASSTRRRPHRATAARGETAAGEGAPRPRQGGRRRGRPAAAPAAHRGGHSAASFSSGRH